MRTIKYTIYALVLIFISCDDFLDHEPSKTTSVVPETTDHLEYILNDYYYLQSEQNYALLYGSDDFGLYPEIYEAGSSIYSPWTTMFALWDDRYVPDQQLDMAWSSGYTYIFKANMVLDYLPRVSGDEQTKKRLKAEAHLMRAYSLWYLVNTYCLPYTGDNGDEPGMVLKESTSFEEPMVRASLAKTYEMIENDLTEALKLDVELTTVNGKYRIWRASRPAVYGFAARYYLFRNNYAEAMRYAGYALEERGELVDYNTEMSFYRNKDEVVINIGTPEQQTVEITYPYTYEATTNDVTLVLQWKELYYLRLLKCGSYWFIPSKELLALYDKQYDLRYKYHYVPNYSYNWGLTNPAYEWPGYVFFGRDGVPSGPTTAEMILIKAECQARLDDYTGAMNTVNLLRAKRMSAEAPEDVIRLTASSKEEAIREILEERRREMPFSIRWFDIRRLNSNEDPNDDVGELRREFYSFTNSAILDEDPVKTYTLPKNSRRYAQPILNTEIERSAGGIKQNIYK